MNKAFLTGHCGKDPEVRTIDSNKQVATFTFATSETYKDKQGQRQTVSTWHNIVAWEKLAELCEKYVKKGTHLTIIGKISNRSYEGKDGQKKYISEIVASEIEFLGTKQTEISNAVVPDSQSEPGDEPNDLPF